MSGLKFKASFARTALLSMSNTSLFNGLKRGRFTIYHRFSMQYHLNEGSFSLPGEEWLDNSMNILRDEASGVTVIISRGAIPENSDFEQEFHRQWDSMRAQMTKLKQSEFVLISVVK